MSLSLRAGAALAALLAGIPMAGPALAQDAAATPAGETPVDPASAALIAEIAALGKADPSADPTGDLVKIADLRRRIAAHGGLPPIHMGLLESAEGAAYF